MGVGTGPEDVDAWVLARTVCIPQFGCVNCAYGFGPFAVGVEKVNVEVGGGFVLWGCEL